VLQLLEARHARATRIRAQLPLIAERCLAPVLPELLRAIALARPRTNFWMRQTKSALLCVLLTHMVILMFVWPSQNAVATTTTRTRERAFLIAAQLVDWAMKSRRRQQAIQNYASLLASVFRRVAAMFPPMEHNASLIAVLSTSAWTELRVSLIVDRTQTPLPMELSARV